MVTLNPAHIQTIQGVGAGPTCCGIGLGCPYTRGIPDLLLLPNVGSAILVPTWSESCVHDETGPGKLRLLGILRTYLGTIT